MTKLEKTKIEIRKTKKKIEVFEKHGFNFARMISHSKSWYLEKHPDHKVVFNSRIYDLETYDKHKDGKILDFFEGMELEIWYGDLDLTIDLPKLKEVAKEIGPFIITTEHGRFVEKVE